MFKGFICGLGVKCDCGTAANLLCGRCLWCHADHVKHWLLFWFVLHGHRSVKELIRAKREECCRHRWKPLKAQRNVWEVKSLIFIPPEKEYANVIIQHLEVDVALIDVFCFSQRQKTWIPGVFPLLACEWVGGSFEVGNQGSKTKQVSVCLFFCFSLHSWGWRG